MSLSVSIIYSVSFHNTLLTVVWIQNEGNLLLKSLFFLNNPVWAILEHIYLFTMNMRENSIYKYFKYTQYKIIHFTTYKTYNLMRYYKLQIVSIPFRLQLNITTELQTDINGFTIYYYIYINIGVR